LCVFWPLFAFRIRPKEDDVRAHYQVAAAAAAKLAFGFVIGRSQAGYSIGMCYMFGLFLVFLATFQLAYFDKILAALCETSPGLAFWVIFGHVIFPPNWWKRTSLNITS